MIASSPHLLSEDAQDCSLPGHCPAVVCTGHIPKEEDALSLNKPAIWCAAFPGSSTSLTGSHLGCRVISHAELTATRALSMLSCRGAHPSVLESRVFLGIYPTRLWRVNHSVVESGRRGKGTVILGREITRA